MHMTPAGNVGNRLSETGLHGELDAGGPTRNAHTPNGGVEDAEHLVPSLSNGILRNNPYERRDS